MPFVIMVPTSAPMFQPSCSGTDHDMQPGDPGWEGFCLGIDGDDWTSFDVGGDPREWTDAELIEIAEEIISQSGGDPA